MNEPVTVVVPTWNNFEQLTEMVSSVVAHNLFYPVRVIVVNNGEPEMAKHPFFQHELITILNPGENLGWEGGLKLGLEHANTEFVMFANDDIVIPEHSKMWLVNLLQPFRNKEVGAVGPVTNCAMGSQNIFTRRSSYAPAGHYEVPFLIGFCMLLRRSALEAAGGVDTETMPPNCGDDIDLSIRLQDAGYKLVMDTNTFVWHYGFSTGTRLYGGPDKPGGWNSQEQGEKTNTALIRKHGLKRWHQCLYTRSEEYPHSTEDTEGNLVRERVVGERVVELGVGGAKTVPNAVGVDLIPKGEVVWSLATHVKSEADITADVTKPMAFADGEFDTLIARHILEHCQDTVETLREWSRIVKKGGRLIVAVPNQEEGSTIPMNPEHLHSFTPVSLKNVAEAVGLKVVEQLTHYNQVSFLTVLGHA